MCRVEKKDDGYIMHNTIRSKKRLCKSLGGKWCPDTLTWHFPATAATSAAALEELYNSALYDEDTPAGWHQRQRLDEEHRKQAREAHQARIEQQKRLWMNTLTATKTIERGDLPHSGSVHDDAIGYFTGPDEEISEIADSIGGQKFRPRPGVLIWINNSG